MNNIEKQFNEFKTLQSNRVKIALDYKKDLITLAEDAEKLPTEKLPNGEYLTRDFCFFTRAYKSLADAGNLLIETTDQALKKINKQQRRFDKLDAKLARPWFRLEKRKRKLKNKATLKFARSGLKKEIKQHKLSLKSPPQCPVAEKSPPADKIPEQKSGAPVGDIPPPNGDKPLEKGTSESNQPLSPPTPHAGESAAKDGWTKICDKGVNK
jgi:hypothetical protein